MRNEKESEIKEKEEPRKWERVITVKRKQEKERKRGKEETIKRGKKENKRQERKQEN